MDVSANKLLSDDDNRSFQITESDIMSNVYSIKGIDRVDIAGTKTISRKSILMFGIAPSTTHPDELAHIEKFKKDHNHLRRSSTRSIKGLQCLSG